MFGLRTSLTAVAAAALVLSLGARHAAAAGPPPPAPNCSAVEQRVEETKELLQACEDDRQGIAAERDSCVDQANAANQKLSASQAHVEACTDSKASLCAEAATFAQKLLDGRVTNVGSCIPGPDQSRLRQLLHGWEEADLALAQVASFAAGESDTLPAAFGATTAERLVARLVGSGPGDPVFYRRLLTEAVKLTAPRSWQRIRAAGPTSVESWFASADPLDTKLVQEAQHVASAGEEGPSLSAALRLVQAYQLITHCREESPAAGCRRARQLEGVFESTGPLLLRQRVEDIWAADCHNIAPGTVLAWVQDFPASPGASRNSDFSEVASAAQAKLFTCFLGGGDTGAVTSFSAWLNKALPSPKALDSRSLVRVDDIRSGVRDDTPLDACGRAVRAMQRLAAPTACVAPPPDVSAAITRWTSVASQGDETSVPLNLCRQYARMLWEGEAATIAPSFDRPPTVTTMVTRDRDAEGTALEDLRSACKNRLGSEDVFAGNLASLATMARGFGEATDGDPWHADRNGAPLELRRYNEAATVPAWVEHLTSRETACRALMISDSRCEQCDTLQQGPTYDCGMRDRLERRWTGYGRVTGSSFGGVFAMVCLVVWGGRMHRARRSFTNWARATRARVNALGLVATADPFRLLLPSRNDVLRVQLPRDAAWERWGRDACIVRVWGPKVQEHQIQHAVDVCRRVGARLVFVLHDDTASLDLGAVRAVLDWAGRGGTRTVHVLPLATSRLEWARDAGDLLDLVEETSLRGNPFEVRGRITSSSQFWNRERLVSGLLAETRAGRWIVITGLRRFGKSSLALEVARRLPGLSAYVDLAGFHHEIAFDEDPSRAVDAILRSLCARLVDSARSLYPSAAVPEAPTGEVDAAALTRAVRDLCAACAPFADGRSPPMLLVVDELEQVLAMDTKRVGHALDVLAILLGRLRNAFGESSSPTRSGAVGVLLCGALHPLLWAPLRTLGQQSIMGAFPSLCVPCLSQEAASAMMRGLGARQGIRFADDALAYVVQQSQGVPLLLRRIGTSLLELYDADHARQGSLGAVNVGREGAREAVAREETEGAPLRVWVESEIAERAGPAGAILRALAASGTIPLAELRHVAEHSVLAQFASSGIMDGLPRPEVQRRAQEAASVILRLLGETGLLTPVGDPISPEGYSLPDGSIRRALQPSPSQP
jgi:hypothetical protein